MNVAFQINDYVWSVCRFIKAAVIWAITTSSLMISIFVGSSFMADMSIVLPLFWTITRKNCLCFHYCHNAELVTFAYEFLFKGWFIPAERQKFNDLYLFPYIVNQMATAHTWFHRVVMLLKRWMWLNQYRMRSCHRQIIQSILYQNRLSCLVHIQMVMKIMKYPFYGKNMYNFLKINGIPIDIYKQKSWE